MTVPTVSRSALSQQAANTTTSTVTLPTTPVAGRLLMGFIALDGAAGASTWPGGWTELLDATVGATVAQATVGYREAAGGDANPGVTHTTERSNHIALEIQDWDTSVPPEISTAASGASTTPDPPSFTPSWGSQDTLFIAVYFNDSGGAVTAWPSNCPDNHLENHTATSAAELALATAGVTGGGAFNPGAFTTTTSDDWLAYVIAVKGTGSTGAALAGVIAAAGTLDATIRLDPNLAGSVDAAGALAGDLTISAPAALAGVVAATGALSGDLTPGTGAALAGIVASASTLTGNLTAPGPGASLGGTIAAFGGIGGALEGSLALPPLSAIGSAFIEIYGPPASAIKWGDANADWGHADADWSASTWQDVTPESMHARISWGATEQRGVLSIPVAGVFTVDTYDPARLLDPSNPSSGFASLLVPGTPFRVRYDGPTMERQVRKGKIERINYSLDTNTGLIVANDAVARLAAVDLPPDNASMPATLYTRIQWVIARSGVTDITFNVPAGTNPIIGGALDAGSHAWRWLDTSALDVLYALWVDHDDVIQVRPYASPVDNGLTIGGATGIPVSDIQIVTDVDGVVAQAVAFDVLAPTVEVVRQDDWAFAMFGKVEYRRERPIPNASDWAQAVVDDRGHATLKVKAGTLRPTTEAQLVKLIDAGMAEVVTIQANAVSPALSIDALIVGGTFEVDTKAGWSATLVTYVPVA